MSNQIIGTYYTVFTANNQLYYDLDASGLVLINIAATVTTNANGTIIGTPVGTSISLASNANSAIIIAPNTQSNTVFVDVARATTAQSGVVQLVDSYQNNSLILAPTANAINALYQIVAAGSSNTALLAWATANSAWATANTANTDAQLAFNQANSAWAQANGANTLAQASFNQANTAYGVGNNAFAQANSAFVEANTANTLAQTAYSQANTANSTTGLGYIWANATYNQANTANSTSGLGYLHASDAYTEANTANTLAQAAYNKANTGGVNDIWNARGGASNTGAILNRIFEENDLTVNTSYTITSNRSAISIGPITVAANITVNVPSGSRWMIF